MSLTVAAAESLTGGLVAAALVAVPGASHVFRGGVVAYATDLKHSVLGVDAELLANRGPVDAEVARQMAVGVAKLMGADIGISTTGAAGPEPQDGHAPGEVYIAVAAFSRGVGVVDVTRRLRLSGTRDEVRSATVASLLSEVLATLETASPPGPE
ncbi:nicotinamide-nucleotide amidase [Rarobacter incanus]|uniref:Nicotinamide-nucleotide amidase n=2 Tax=Rarobacter incanus TaxID=153494 RepID=A0A542SLF2_9MICO|nr:nicotinamide-nucleotide amidase [Rarobacter incanus]